MGGLTRCATAAVIAALAGSGTVAATPYPSQPIRLIVPLAAGGPADHVARTIAPALAKALEQPVVVENRAGADGVLGAQAALAAAPDGHTLLLAGGGLVAAPLLRKPAPFAMTDFVPVSKISSAVWALFVAADVPARSVSELIALARAKPGGIAYASSTTVDFLAASRFMNATATRLVKVPYKGVAQALPDLAAGRVQVNFSPLSTAVLAQVSSGRLRPLAVLAPRRSALLPEVPTMIESGIPDLAVPGWLALFAPPRTAAHIVARLHRELGAVLQDPMVRAQLERQSMEPDGSGPAALAATLAHDAVLWQQFIREHLIAAD
ncbi:MAG TPA: tripartite tricarboxylate transporter substrate binding protein [Burkholderiaceae bacterium]|nr:tripartite tricarboxylate transporter substrate binding protein [Burkholderiaceae bacterium]